MRQNLVTKALAVYIAVELGKSFGSFALVRQKKIVHMYYLRAVFFRQ
jgi:hypothetical protein